MCNQKPLPHLLCSPYFCYTLLKDFPRNQILSTDNLLRVLSEKYCEIGILSKNGYDEINEWRSAMGKLGFIYPEIKHSMGFSQEDLGQLDTITPAGKNLISAETVPAIQECYLRSMIAPTTPMGDGSMFSPLRLVLAILLELERRGFEPAVSFPEMATIVILSTPADGLNEIVDNILSLR